MKIRLLLLLLTTCYWSVNAQIPGEPLSVQGPNAASLGQYGEIPVSLFTGLPSIDIPLYTVQEGTVSVPLSISYHASGFRPDVHPGWVGMGWNLNAGGAISRTIHQMPDEINNAKRCGPSGYYFSHNLLSGSDWFSTGTIANKAQAIGCDVKDTEPDEFAFNFGEYSGKFYLSTEGKWLVKCNKPVTVVPCSVTVDGQASYFLDCAIPLPTNHNYSREGASKTFAGFIVTTENGTQYVFGGTTTAIEYQVGLFSQLDEEWVAGTWNLTQIIHPDGHRVSFTYERISGEYVSQMYYNLGGVISTQVRYDRDGGIIAFFTDPTPSSPCGGNDVQSPPPYYRSTSGKLIAPVYLTTINTSLCTVTFSRAKSVQLRYREGVDLRSAYKGHDPGNNYEFLSYLMRGGGEYKTYPDCLSRLQWQKLTGITVKTTSTSAQPAQLIKGLTFGYNDDPSERLTLLSVTEQGTSVGATKPPYRFGYNKYHSLPEYLLDQVDHWGFFNNNYVEIGNNASPDFGNYYSHREPTQDSAVYLAGMLTRIVYPTGGKTDFQYVQHRFGSELNENRFVTPATMNTPTPAGGVRIGKITSYSPDQPNQKLEKEYFYVTGYTPTASTYDLANLPSSGVLGGRARYTWGSYKARSYSNTKFSYSRSLFSGQSVLPASSNSAGSHIGYSTVIEKRSDGSYTQYAYSNFTAGNGDPGHLDEPPLNQLQTEFTDSDVNNTNRILYSPYCSTEEERGKLLREEAFNNVGQRVRLKVIEYTALNKNVDAYTIRAVKGSSTFPCSQTSAGFAEGSSYKLYVYSYLPNRETETIYDPTGGNPVTTVKSKTYSPLGYRLVAAESMTDSKNQTLTTTYRYPFDITLPGGSAPTQSMGDPVASAINAMTAKNMIGSPIETITTRNGLVTAAAVQTYRLGGLNNSSILPFQYFNLEATQPLNQYTPTTYGNNGDPNSPLIIGGGISQMRLKATFKQYDTKSNPLSLVKDGGTLSSYIWGYGGTLLTAQVDNASRILPIPSNISIGNEASYLGFESGTASPGTDPDEDYWNIVATANNSFVSTAHTGNFSWRMGPTSGYNFGPGHIFIPERQQLSYTLSAWVKTEAGYTANSGHLVMSVNRQDGTYAGATGCYQATDIVDTNGKWQYIEVALDLNAAHNNLGIPVTATSERLQINVYPYSYNGGTAGFLVDDLRFQPTDAQMTTYTHAPLVGPTSKSDANSHPVYYDYDELSRLWLVRDQNRNIVKHYQYHYQR